MTSEKFDWDLFLATIRDSSGICNEAYHTIQSAVLKARGLDTVLPCYGEVYKVGLRTAVLVKDSSCEPILVDIEDWQFIDGWTELDQDAADTMKRLGYKKLASSLKEYYTCR